MVYLYNEISITSSGVIYYSAIKNEVWRHDMTEKPSKHCAKMKEYHVSYDSIYMKFPQWVNLESKLELVVKEVRN